MIEDPCEIDWDDGLAISVSPRDFMFLQELLSREIPELALALQDDDPEQIPFLAIHRREDDLDARFYHQGLVAGGVVLTLIVTTLALAVYGLIRLIS